MFGFDTRTSSDIVFAVKHPLMFCWRWIRSCNIDFDKELFRERENQMVDFALMLPNEDREEYHEEIAWLKANRWNLPTRFPYDRVRNPNVTAEFEVDKKNHLPYVEHNGVRVYFCQDMSVAEVRRIFENYVETEGILGHGLLAKSPHSYVTEHFHPEQDDVIVDIGCSEGFFAATYAAIARKIFLFEAEKKWDKPLENTFAPYRDKTLLFSKFVGNKTTSTEIKLEDAIDMGPDSHYFIKMDIEGGEVDVVRASLDFLSKNKAKISCCTYHRQSDADVLSKMLRSIGYQVSFSDGYMLMTMNGVRYPYFRHGVLYAKNYT